MTKDAGYGSYCTVRLALLVGPVGKHRKAHCVLGLQFPALALSFEVSRLPSVANLPVLRPLPRPFTFIAHDATAPAADAHLPYNSRAFFFRHDALAPLPSPRNQSPGQQATRR